MRTYTPTDWENGDLITENLMDKAENGIAYATTKSAFGSISKNETSVTVSFDGDYLTSYAIMSNEHVLVKTEVGTNEVTFTLAEKPPAAVHCFVLYL